MTKREFERFRKFTFIYRSLNVKSYGLSVITYKGEIYSPKVSMEYQSLGGTLSPKLLPIRKTFLELFYYENGPIICDHHGNVLGINYRYVQKIDLWVRCEDEEVKYF